MTSNAPAFDAGRRPRALDILGECRFPLEAANFLFRIPALPRAPVAPHLRKTVMFIPGFMAGDATLAPMARFCRKLGHRTVFGGLWINNDCPRVTKERLANRLRRAYHEHGAPLAIVGHSLGGLYARELAHEFPLMIERLITLGAPIREPRMSCHPAILRMVNAMTALRGRRSGCLTEECACGVRLSKEPPPRALVTVIYSRSDGIVNWQNCIDRSGSELVDHAEVAGSHCGMALSHQVYQIVADRLARPLRPGLRERPGLRLVAPRAAAR